MCVCRNVVTTEGAESALHAFNLHTHTHTLGWASHIVLPGVYNLVNSGLEIAAKYLQPGDKLSSLLVPAGPHIQKQHIKLIFMMHVLPLVITR